MNSSLSQYYLKMMGIQVWRECHTLPGAAQKINYHTYTLISSRGEPSGQLWLEMFPMKPCTELAMLQLLDLMMQAIKLERAVFQPETRPSFQIVMGESLAQYMLDTSEPLDSLREKNWHNGINNFPTLVTYHPLTLHLEPSLKRKAWDDLRKILAS